jgi:hypothetical protein
MSVLGAGTAAIGLRPKLDEAAVWCAVCRRRPDDRVFGELFHFVVSLAVAVYYAAGFQLLGATSHLWAWGALGGVIHWLVGGAYMAFVPQMRLRSGTAFAAPGAFALGLGRRDLIGFLVAHLAYGVVFGISYGILHSQGGLALAL